MAKSEAGAKYAVCLDTSRSASPIRVVLDNSVNFSGNDTFIARIITDNIVEFASIPWGGRAARGW
jgi:hypothetical protein